MFLKNKIAFLMVSALCITMHARDILVEFKAAYFQPTGCTFKNIYQGGALYGPEVTFQFCEQSPWYGFASADFLSKSGHSLGLCTPTKVYIVPLGLGVKYFEPFCYGNWYVGLGFQPTHLKTVNCSPAVVTTSHWGFGGIFKIGAYIDLSCNFFADLFFDYSFVTVGCQQTCQEVVAVKADISGAIFGVGIGYKF